MAGIAHGGKDLFAVADDVLGILHFGFGIDLAEAKAAYDKNPSDAAAKKAYTDAMFQNAEYYMYTSPAPPNQKYPKALALYRQVLKLEPDNVRAKESAEIIEGIYRQMGRPVPEV